MKPDNDISRLSCYRMHFSAGNHVCNGTRPHTAIVGNNITYNCRFKYYGSRRDPFVWRGPGTSSGKKFSNVIKSDQPVWTDTHNGENYLNNYSDIFLPPGNNFKFSYEGFNGNRRNKYIFHHVLLSTPSQSNTRQSFAIKSVVNKRTNACIEI